MTEQFITTNIRGALRSVLEADEELESGDDEAVTREALAAAAKRARQKLNAARWALEHVLDRVGSK